MSESTSARLGRIVVSGGAACLSLWLFAVLSLWLGESWLVYRTDLSRAYTASLDRSVFGALSLTAADGMRLDAVTLRHKGDRDRYWVLFFPPAGGSTRVKMIQGQLKTLWELGYNVLACDYHGFGGSPGSPTEERLYADGLVAYRYLTEGLGVSADRIILSGRSLGAAVGVEVATRVPAAGLLLFAPIDSVPSVGSRLFPWAPVRLLATHRFDTRAKAPLVDVPVIVVHGYPDRMMRPSNTRSLLQAFRGPKRLLETGGGHHHAGFTDVPLLYRAMREFWPVPGASARR